MRCSAAYHAPFDFDRGSKLALHLCKSNRPCHGVMDLHHAMDYCIKTAPPQAGTDKQERAFVM